MVHAAQRIVRVPILYHHDSVGGGGGGSMGGGSVGGCGGTIRTSDRTVSRGSSGQPLTAADLASSVYSAAAAAAAAGMPCGAYHPLFYPPPPGFTAHLPNLRATL